ncbi:MAG TPA: energy transducer TonB [Edaphobacter sp.]
MRRIFLLISILFLSSPFRTVGQTTGSVPASDMQESIGTENNPLRVSSGVIASLAISQPRAVFGKIPCGTKTSGTTVMRAIINPQGKVDRVEIISGPEALRQPILDAVRQWTYKPYLLNGKAIWVRTTVTMDISFGSCDSEV